MNFSLGELANKLKNAHGLEMACLELVRAERKLGNPDRWSHNQLDLAELSHKRCKALIITYLNGLGHDV